MTADVDHLRDLLARHQDAVRDARAADERASRPDATVDDLAESLDAPVRARSALRLLALAAVRELPALLDEIAALRAQAAPRGVGRDDVARPVTTHDRDHAGRH